MAQFDSSLFFLPADLVVQPNPSFSVCCSPRDPVLHGAPMESPPARWECLWPTCRARQSMDNSIYVQGPDVIVHQGRYSIDFDGW